MERVPFFPTTELISQKSAWSMSAHLILKIKINKSQGSDSGNDLRARGKKNEEISRLKNQGRGRERK